MTQSEKCLQEDPEAKERWRRWAFKNFPIGAPVRVLASDVPAYVGLTGRVRGYDIGYDGEWPRVSIDFDVPPFGFPTRDSFYADGGDAEIELVGFAPLARLRAWLGRRVRVSPAHRGQGYDTGVHVEWWGRFPGYFFVDVPGREVELRLYLESVE